MKIVLKFIFFIFSLTIYANEAQDTKIVDNQHVNKESKINKNGLIGIFSVAIFFYILFLIRNYELKKIIASKTSKLSKQLDIFNEYVISVKIGLSGQIDFISDAFCQVSGYTKAQFIEKSLSAHKPQIIKLLQKALKNDKAYNAVIYDYTIDNKLYHLDIKIQPQRDENGSVVGYIALATDISANIKLQNLTKNLENTIEEKTSELYLSNNRLQMILDSANIGILLLENRKIKQINPKASQMFGYSQDELLDHTTQILTQNQEEYKKIEHYYKIAQNGQIATWDQNLICKNKTSFLARIHLKTINTNDKALIAVATIEDITAEYEVLDNIKKAKQKAENIAKIKSEFLANMSHEIRTPLNAIIGLSYLVLQTNLDSKQKDFIQKIDQASKNLLNIINDILDFSKIESGKMSLEHKEFNLGDLLCDISNIFIYKAQEKNLDLLLQLDRQTPNALIGDYTKLYQILINLLSNAIKFTHSGRVILSIEPTRFVENFVVLKFQIQDTGIGLSDEQIKQLFQPFQQVDGSIARKYGGTGLGLSISKHLVEMMGGTIGVKSTLAEGSNFYFSIKVELPQNSIKQNIITDKIESKLLPFTSSTILDIFVDTVSIKDKICEVTYIPKAKVLLVEDNEQNQLIATKLLDKIKADVDIAKNGQEAVDKALKNDYDIILMDCQMPILDGYEATKIIRMQDKNIPIIAMSANSLDNDIKKCFLTGMNDYITKPIEIDKFYTTLRKWIHIDQELNTQQDFLTPSLNIYGIDASKALSRMMGNKELLFEILDSFATKTKDSILTIKNLIQNSKKEEYLREIHTLKGLSGNIEAKYLFYTLRKLEDALKDENPNSDLVDFILLDARNELQKIVSSINENTTKKELNFKNNQDKLDISKIKSDIKKAYELIDTLDIGLMDLSKDLSDNLHSYIQQDILTKLKHQADSFSFDEMGNTLKLIEETLKENKDLNYV